MAYEVPALGTAGQVYTAAAHNIIVNDVIAIRNAQVNVQSTTLTSATTMAVNTTPTNITGITVTITPSTNTSKILLLVFASIDNDSGVIGLTYSLARGGTAIGIGDAAGSRVRSTIDSFDMVGLKGAIILLDSPGTTSPVTYTLQVRCDSGTGTTYINRTKTDTNAVGTTRTISTITAIEIAV